MRQLHAAGFGCNGYLDGNEVRHDEPPEYQKQCHSHGDKSGNGTYQNFTVNDWKQLWKDFAVAFDEQVIRDKDGKTVSDNTNVSGSKSSVWLHEESKSGIPHLHAIVSRVDEDGNINNDHAIHLRAQRAAEKVALQRGWTTAMHVHEDNIPEVSADCIEVLRGMSSWSWEDYTRRLATKGYKLYQRKDKEGLIRGYVLIKGNAKYKASELGKGRNLTASHLRQTWERLHPEQVKQKEVEPKRPVVPTSSPSITNETIQKPQPVAQRNRPVYEEYLSWQPGRQRTEFEHEGKTYNRYLPDKVIDCLNDEFDYRELVNWQALQNLTMAFFTLVASPYGEVTGGGGGGSQSDLKWGRDPEEDEIDLPAVVRARLRAE